MVSNLNKDNVPSDFGLSPVYHNIQRISKSLSSKPLVLLFCHWDAIMRYYSKETVRPAIQRKIRELLHKLNSGDRRHVTIISSLSLERIESQFKLGELIYAGNFGFEIESRSFGWNIPGVKNYKRHLKKLTELIEANEKLSDKLEISNLGLIYQIRWDDTSLTNRQIKQTILPLLDNPDDFKIINHPRKIDLLPNVDWNLASCVDKISTFLTTGQDNYVRFYFGAVKNDEPVFTRLNAPTDFPVWVGAPPVYRTAAPYILKNLKEMIQFLDWINTK